jgi:ketosteroid isomerase-like protein
MSANLDLVRSIYVSVDRGEFSIARWADPQIEWVMPDGPEPGTYVGVAEMERGLRNVMNSWLDYRVTVDEYHELDAERVLVLIHRRGRGRASGLDLATMDTEGATLYQIRDGKIIRMLNYWDRERAFADLGLEMRGAGDRRR